jgi:hypothetical protein
MRLLIRQHELEQRCRRWYHPFSGELVFVERGLPAEDALPCEAMKVGDGGRFNLCGIDCRVDQVAWVQKVGEAPTLHLVVRKAM